MVRSTPTFVPKNDDDGNEIAGIRLPELTVPLATYTGWALRAGPQANDGCEGSGQYIPFPKTKAERSGDPRKSVAECYKSTSTYRKEVARAIDNLVRDRFLLCEDTGDMLARLVPAGLDAGIPEADDPTPQGPKPPKNDISECR
jgi:hypothetical protein